MIPRPQWGRLLMNRTFAALSFVAALCAAAVRADQVDALRAPDRVLSDQDACVGRHNARLYARTELLFGLARASGRSITDAEFRRFVDAEVTPRFPDGLTWLSGDGQFKSAAGTTIREGSKLLILLYGVDEDRSKLVEEVREAYKRAFEQESVLRTDSRLCVSF
jgi:hypothetical protein